ncbi:MAG: hypothetical protein ACRDIV_11870 [Ktedonobacteraceae bacterium]
MLRRTCLRLVGAFIMALCIITVSFALFPVSHSLAAQKPELHLNRQSGPLGVTLTLNGTNFPPGVANLSYIDSQNVPGMFSTPGDTSVQVTDSDSFVTNNLILPQSGAVGPWKIVITDSLGTISTTLYTVLAAPGQTTAGTPTLTLNPSNGTGGDTITFTGTNWLPEGTPVNLLLQTGTNAIPLLQPAPVSDNNGTINGNFHLPLNLNIASATVVASDASTGALRAQAAITIGNGTATPTLTPTSSPSPTVTVSPIPTSTPTTAATSTPIVTTNNGSGSDNNNTGNPLGKMDAAVWGPVLLAVGAILAIAALMLVLFMIPWGGERNHNQELR